jgi:dimethylhistidine N-methyltransferase
MARNTGRTTQTLDRDAASVAQFVGDVQYYLAQKPRQLPSRYFYDELGSALFEAICRLPWYRITRAEMRLLAAHGRDILDRVQPLSTIVELGSGSGDKLRMLIDADRTRLSPLDVHLVDVSRGALDQSLRTLAAVDDINVISHQSAYETGLRDAVRGPHADGATLVLFLGSNIGNFDPPGAAAFLRTLRGNLCKRDVLLLGADLVKPRRDLLLAYDDPLGVTAAFNRNLLVRINRELGGTFDLDAFAHRARWNARESRVEMHLVARSAQRVRIEAAQLDFRMTRGEPIWTESSYKYRPEDVVAMLETAGFRLVSQWIDDADAFALTLVSAE